MGFGDEIRSGYVHVSSMNSLVLECRKIADSLSLVIRWRVKEKTATVVLKERNRTIWKGIYSNDMPHLMLLYMYEGLYEELQKRLHFKNLQIKRMQQIEEERAKERKIAQMPTWHEKINQQKT